ncbi:MAG: 2OG-Fe(II) oxygenase family protein [Pseudomonadota bacterium]
MTDWLNPTLDRAACAEAFRSNRHIRIGNILNTDKAAGVLRSLGEVGEWSLLCGTEAGTAVIDTREMKGWPREKQAEFQASLAASGRKGQGFAFLGYRMDDRWAAGAPDTPLGHFYDALMGPEIRGLVSEISGYADLNGVSVQATRFGPSHYLTRHRDDPTQERRRLAFAWGFTPQWHPDWGGLLQFYNDAGAPTLSFAPGFNTLDIHDIDQVQAVTFVAPFAGHVRQAVSGWYLSAPAGPGG